MNYLALLSLLLSLGALACPNLAGTYKDCKTYPKRKDGPSKLSVVQKKDGDFQVYELQGETTEVLYADGKERVLRGVTLKTKRPFEQKSTSTCVGDKVLTKKAYTENGKDFVLSDHLLVKERGKLLHKYSNHTKKESYTVICE